MTNTSFGQQPNVPHYPSPVQATYPQDPNMTTDPYAPQSATPYPTNPYPAAPAVDPGRTLGIVGLLLAIFFNVVGLVVSIIAFRKSKQAGFKNGLALAGIIIGALATLGLITVGIVGGIGASHLVEVCKDLGPGTHVVNGVTYTCG